MTGYVKGMVKGTSMWPKRTISVTNKSAKLTSRQSGFAKGLAGVVGKSLNVKNKY